MYNTIGVKSEENMFFRTIFKFFLQNDSYLYVVNSCEHLYHIYTCCRADKYVDPASDLSLCVQVMTAKDNEGNKGEVTNITKIKIYCRVYKRVSKIRGSSICVFS